MDLQARVYLFWIHTQNSKKAQDDSETLSSGLQFFIHRNFSRTKVIVSHQRVSWFSTIVHTNKSVGIRRICRLIGNWASEGVLRFILISSSFATRGKYNNSEDRYLWKVRKNAAKYFHHHALCATEKKNCYSSFLVSTPSAVTWTYNHCTISHLSIIIEDIHL